MEPEPKGEKRHLTVQFSDLCDSTQLCGALGEERFHQVVLEFLRNVADAVEANGGYVARYMGDGLLAYFGYPDSSEDDSVRAVRAALAARSSIAALRKRTGIDLHVRSGVATGPIILGNWLGEGAAQERPVVGVTANLAARLQSAAGLDEILVAEASYRLARSAFRFSARAEYRLKGFDDTAAAYSVLEAQGWEHRGWSTSLGGRLVGRSAEFALLSSRLTQAGQGEVRLIAIIGEAGIGKSALADTFLAQTDLPAVQVVRAQANPSSTNTPFFLARQLFDDDPFSDAGDKNERLADEVERAAVERLASRCESQAHVIVLEDIHWADPSSLNFAARLAREHPAPLLLVVTSREPLSPTLRDLDFEPLPLSVLNRSHMIELILREAPRARAEAIDRVVDRAAGVPLFGVELARHLAVNGPASSEALPWSLSELVAARLSSLQKARHLAGGLAILGLSSDAPTLAALARMDAAEFEANVATLHSTGAVRIAGAGDQRQIEFSHALIRDALYDSLFEGERRELHRKAAGILAGRPASAAPSDAIAQHWAASGEHEKAAAAFADAAEQFRLARGYPEAEIATTHGLEALGRMTSSPRRDAIELALQATRASVLQIRLGYSAIEAKAAASRSRVLSERQGELRQQFTAMAGEWMASSSAGDHLNAAKAAKQLLAIANSAGAADLLAAAWMAEVTSRFRIGDLEGSERAFEAGSPYFRDARFADRPGAIAQTYGNAALVAALLGDAGPARSRAAFAVRHARRLASKYDICFASYMAGMLALLLGSDQMACRLSERAMRLADALAFPQFIAIARIVHGRAKVGLGDSVAGLASMHDGIAGMDSTNSRVGMTLYLSWLAEAQLMAGQYPEAAEAIARALSSNPEERFYLPETLRLKGRILECLSGQTAEKSALYRSASEAAEQMNGRWFQNRLALVM